MNDHEALHYNTRIGRSSSPAGNDCLDPYFGLSCVIGWVQPYRVEGFLGMATRHHTWENPVWRPVSVLPARASQTVINSTMS